jgi:GTPase involved in cell partitioning and DNA repair
MPNLGVMTSGGQQQQQQPVLADLPGLIEGWLLPAVTVV